MSNESPENEWELSKENVQPLRQGRKISSLNAGLKQLSGDEISRIKEEKHAFEGELRTYNGSDPLEVWYKYILWCEQTFPKGGRESNLTSILERCVRQFKDEDNYRNDERYIYAWMKLADICNEPLEIYTFMYDQNIGCELSCFYEGWACLLEHLGNFKKADAIFQNGLDKHAKPPEQLRLRHEEFQKRVARRMIHGADSEADNSPQDNQHRQVLSQLRTLGKKRQAPVQRVGTAVKGGACILSAGDAKSRSNTNSGGIPIFCDENNDPSTLPPQTGQWATVPKQDVNNKENEKKPGIWTKQKIGKSSSSVPVSAVASYKQLAFSVHEDENNDQSLRTPAKKPEIDSQKVLSTRKQEKDTTRSYLKTMSDQQDKTERPMYCKEKIYLGIEEYSFEELRAIRWLKKEEKKKHEEEERAVEEIRLKLEQERQQLLDEAERVKQQRLKLQQEEQAMIEVARRQRLEHQQKMELERNAEIQRQQEILEKDIQKRLNEQMSNSKTQGSSRQLMFEEGSHGNTENIPPHMMAQLRSSNSKRQNVSAISSHSLNSSGRTPNSSVRMNHPSSSEKSFDRTMSGAPSPTVNTKEAMRLVMGMFNVSLDMDKQGNGDDVDMGEPEQYPVPQAAASGGGLPFAIYDESKEAAAPTVTQKPPAPFTIFQEEEASSAPQPMNTSASNVLKEPMMQQSYQESIGDHRSLRSRHHSTHPMFDECEGIESHPRDDITLAPLGSHLSFAASARVASTPFNPNSSANGARCSPANLNDSDIDMQTDQGPHFHVDLEPMLVNSDVPNQQQVSQEQTVNNSMSNLSAKNLSPIMEGSSEESNQSSQLQHGVHPPVMGKLQLTPVLDQSENTRNLLQAVDERNQSVHLIDTSAYEPPEMDEKTEQLFNQSIMIVDPKDPFDAKEREQMLTCLKTSLHHMGTFNDLDENMPNVQKGDILTLGVDAYEIVDKIGEGGFAKVYLAEDNNDFDFGTRCLSSESVSTSCALKVEKPAQKWEFYICNELHNRLSKLKDPFDTRPGIMQISNGYFYDNGSILVTEYQSHGTLLDLVNKCKKNNLHFESLIQQLEPIMMYMTIELLHMIEHMHQCQIIHGDIKPDNFLVLTFPRLPKSTDPNVVFGGTSRFVQLIDFGRSIDMKRYPAGTTFVAKVRTECFQCIEMKTNRPWTYQTDLFGLAGTIHVLVFNQYMNVYPEAGEWKMTSKFSRNWNTALWKKLFHVLLNIPSCDDLPDLSVIRKEFEHYFLNNLLENYNTQCASFNKAINTK